MGIKNKGCGCLTLLLAAPGAIMALTFLRSCIVNLTTPQTIYHEDVPGATDKFVKEQLSKDTPAETPSKPAVPTGSFTVDIKSNTGKDRRFQFNVAGRDLANDIKMSVVEIGDGNSNFGGPIRFNVIFWDQYESKKDGLKFQLNFNQNGGCSVTKPTGNVKTIYMAKKERVCVKRYSNGEILFATVKPVLGKGKNVRSYELRVPENFTAIPSSAVKMHEKYNIPFEPERQQKNAPSRQSSSR